MTRKVNPEFMWFGNLLSELEIGAGTCIRETNFCIVIRLLLSATKLVISWLERVDLNHKVTGSIPVFTFSFFLE